MKTEVIEVSRANRITLPSVPFEIPPARGYKPQNTWTRPQVQPSETMTRGTRFGVPPHSTRRPDAPDTITEEAFLAAMQAEAERNPPPAPEKRAHQSGSGKLIARNIAQTAAVLAAIADGCATVLEIHQRTGINKKRIARLASNMIERGQIELGAYRVRIARGGCVPYAVTYRVTQK